MVIGLVENDKGKLNELSLQMLTLGQRLAEQLGLPIDAVRVGVYGPNVSALREFARSARHPA